MMPIMPFVLDKTVRVKLIENASQWGYDEPVLEIFNDYSCEMIPMSKLAEFPFLTLKGAFENLARREAEWIVELMRWMVGVSKGEESLKEVIGDAKKKATRTKG